MTETTLLEPSIADALKEIETATGLPASKRRHLSCSLRQICVYLNRPPDIVPARWSGIKDAVHDLHAARVGANAKTLANHKANCRRHCFGSPRRKTCRRQAHRSCQLGQR
jgi:hypothetical protein